MSTTSRLISFIDGVEDEELKHLDSKPNKAQYIKELIRKDMGMPTPEEIIAQRIIDVIQTKFKSVSFEVTCEKPEDGDTNEVNISDIRNLMGVCS